MAMEQFRAREIHRIERNLCYLPDCVLLLCCVLFQRRCFGFLAVALIGYEYAHTCICTFCNNRLIPILYQSHSHEYGNSLADTGGDIRHDVFERMMTTLKKPNNVKEINMLSVEILLKFQVEYGFQRVARTLEAFVDNANNPHETGEHAWWSQRIKGSSMDSDQPTCDPVLATSLVYYLNRLVQREGCTVFQRLAACSDYVVSRIVILLLGIMSRPISHKANELECTTSFDHIVEGCVCCLAALNQICLEITSASRSSLVNVVTLCEIMVLLTSYGYPKLEIARKMSTRAIGQLVDQLGVLERDPLSIQARICCCRAVLYAIKHAKELALSLIFRIVVRGFLSALETTDQDPKVKDIMLQVLYAALAKAQPDFRIGDVGPTIRTIHNVISRRLDRSANGQMYGIMTSILKLLHSSAKCNEYLDGDQASFK
uniref:AlNc14C5G705 protein n=1 Tax=Albugo laibachii Nc14 TaxID=890382 RepID=F0W0S0_9STRA|nr:AlNc14C5G705 [Albugo laibachii Nc14]|eukprot:CCA14644.1 AlNc14C5G705 [Albugo laibachii Nc14]